MNPLFRLALLSGAEAAVRLHAKRCDNINARDSDGRSPLLLAVGSGNVECCKLLLDAGADPALSGTDGLDALGLAIQRGRSDLEQLISKYLPSAPQGDDGDLTSDSSWIEEPESSVPQNDPSCLEAATLLQQRVSEHIFIDDSEDWSDVQVELPEGTDFLTDFDDQVSVFLRQCLAIGRTSYCAIDDVASRLSTEEDFSIVASRLILLLGDLGVIVDEMGLLPFDRANTESSFRDSISEGLQFLRDLSDPIVDPYNCFVRDLGRSQLLTPDQEKQLAMHMDAQFDGIALELSCCPSAIRELITLGDSVIDGTVSLEVVLDHDRARPEISDARLTDTDDVGEAALLENFAQKVNALRRASKRGAEQDRAAAIRELHLSPNVLQELAATLTCKGQRDTAELVEAALGSVATTIEEFFRCNARLVFQIARRYVRPTMPLSDLLQEGNIGLLKAIRRFDWRKGYRFSTYATWWIRQAVTRALANDGRLVRIPVHVNEALRLLTRTITTLRQELGREPLLEEVAERLQWPAKKAARYSSYLEDIASLDALIQERTEESIAELAYDEPMLKVVVQEELSRSLDRVLGTVSSKQAHVLRSRFGIGMNDEQTLEEVGEEFGVTRERIRQIEAKVLRLLRQPARRRLLECYVDWEPNAMPQEEDGPRAPRISA